MKQCSCLILLVGILALAFGGAAYGAFNPLKDPAIVGWWTCDEGTGTVVADSSPNHRDGTAYAGVGGAALVGTLTWAPGVYGNAIELKNPNLVQIPAINQTLTDATMAGWMKPLGAQAAWTSIMMTRGSATGLNINPDAGNLQLCYHWGDAATSWGYRPNAYMVNNEWTFAAVTITPSQAVFYVNGAPASTNVAAHAPVNWNAAIFLGGDGSGSQDPRRMTDGLLDDVSLFSRALTADEIKAIMEGLVDPVLAGLPSPADGAIDVPQDVDLAWKAGETAASHDVYFGASEADVALVSGAQAAATFEPGALEVGKTYYWRIDEIDASGTVSAGAVWSFTVEPATYPIKSITATASSQSRADTGPENTLNGSGLNASDQHSVDLKTMWMSSDKPLPNWIQYEFDKVYKLAELWVWNSNQVVEPYVGFGAKTVTVEYSTDGAAWTKLENAPAFSQGTGLPTYTANTVVDFGGVNAKYVKLTVNATWGGVVKQTSLSEVRFFYKPVQAREPQPADAATDVALTASMNWRPGREATSHKVFFGTDGAAVTAGAASAGTVTEHSYTPASMTFGTKYFWKVNEVGDAGTYEGAVWSFTTQEFSPIDDFESYTDDEGSRIYEYWFDGIADAVYGGSTVGYMEAPFAEKAIVHAGKQSMPLAYDNTKAPYFSEAVKELDTAVNCTGSGATELCVWTRGRPALATTAVTETGGKMTLTGSGADIWNNSDEFTYAYKPLTGDGTLVARVTSTGTGTNTWAKGGVMIRDSVNGNSMQAMMAITTPGVNGASFQYRATTAGASASADSAAVVAVPGWVKIERSGSTFTGYTSADGKAWNTVGTTIIEMADPVLIGIAVTSHVATEERTFQFESIAATGTVTGTWQGAIVNAAQYNDAAPMYLTVTDSAGKSATATSATAAIVGNWTRWTIPMSSLNGVSFSKVKKITVGVGAKNATTGGSGMVYIDDIGYGRSVPVQP